MFTMIATRVGCELLSKSYLCTDTHTEALRPDYIQIVVNCFQNRIFAQTHTSLTDGGADSARL